MPCFSPIHVKNARQSSLRRSGSTFYNLVPCGKCIGCLRAKQMQYAFRMEYEAIDPSNKMIRFCTFTFAPKYLPEDNELCKAHVQRYVRRLKKYLPDGVRVRYFFCGEHGSPDKTERAHYHCILFFSEIVPDRFIAKAWPFGRVDVAEPSLARFGYVAKYSLKQLGDGSEKWKQPPFFLVSNGLGFYFLQKHGEFCRKHYINSWINASGYNVLLPRIFMERLFPPKDKVHLEAARSNPAAAIYYRSFVGSKSVLDCKRRTSYEARVSVQSLQKGLSVAAFQGVRSLGNSFLYETKVESIFSRVKYETGRY